MTIHNHSGFSPASTHFEPETETPAHIYHPTHAEAAGPSERSVPEGGLPPNERVPGSSEERLGDVVSALGNGYDQPLPLYLRLSKCLHPIDWVYEKTIRLFVALWSGWVAAGSMFMLASGVAIAEIHTKTGVQTEVLSKATASWDGGTYKAYPSGQPEITILKITIAPHTVMKWHSHSVVSAGYILSGDLTIEKKNGTKQHFVAGQAVTESVDAIHRGISGDKPTVLIVFYAGAVGIPLSTIKDE